ncbi:chromosome partitioning protein, ParA family [Richelia intracellularis HH01]|uniref:Chromosome partitioning protein, ParA family n=1 Tax=Richelia intracellularis HH01 TaxID=1165094 RepID=M1X545_9NOST|nr:ParA family protein [Richelia intracellularis]CCH67081.1 chromosome partitioning protein, ParA family [Richelia intracellularis HH01]HAE05608.1 ParA family protein [Richelia sp.]
MIITVAAFKGGVGKSTTALHLATYLQTQVDTLLVDGDLNRSTLDLANRGELPFKVCDQKEGIELAKLYEHVVIDTPTKPNAKELKTLLMGCDLLVIPSTPDAMALSATLSMVYALPYHKVNYRILLTIVPSNPNNVGEEAKNTLKNAGFPVFKSQIRRLAVFQRAALEGIPVNAIKDSYAQIAWRCYTEVGKEIIDLVLE